MSVSVRRFFSSSPSKNAVLVVVNVRTKKGGQKKKIKFYRERAGKWRASKSGRSPPGKQPGKSFTKLKKKGNKLKLIVA